MRGGGQSVDKRVGDRLAERGSSGVLIDRVLTNVQRRVLASSATSGRADRASTDTVFKGRLDVDSVDRPSFDRPS